MLSFIYGTSLHAQLVAHYGFDGNLLDSSPNSNDGSGGSGYTDDQDNNPLSAVSLSGGSFIQYLNNNLEAELPVTIAAWIHKNDVGQNSSFLVFTNQYQDNYYDGVWLNINQSDKIVAGFGDSGPVGPGSRRSKTGITSLSPNKWHHVAVVIRASLDMDIYLDGINDCGTYSGTGGPTPSYSSGLPGVSGKSDMQATNSNPLHYGNGDLNDIYFFNNALTQLDIWQLAFGNTNLPPVLSNCDPPVSACDDLNIQADFTYTNSGMDFQFFDQTAPTPNYISWDFGDMNSQISGQGDPVTHSYANGGWYTVCMELFYFMDCEECTFKVCKEIFVPGVPPGGGNRIAAPSSEASAATSPATEGTEIAEQSSGIDCQRISIQPQIFVASTNGLIGELWDQTIYDPLQPPTYMVWDFDDGTTQTTSVGTDVTHTFPGPGLYNVCLTSYLHDGCDVCVITYCEPVLITGPGPETRLGLGTGQDALPEWTLYPNPATSVINIDASNIEGKYSLDILDLSGKVVQSHRGLGHTQLKIDTLSKGMYLLILKSNGLRSTKKLYVN